MDTTSSAHASAHDATPVGYFSEAQPGTAALRLAAVVAWRGVPTRAALAGGGGLLGGLRSLRHRLWLRLGPLGNDWSAAGHPLFGGFAQDTRGVHSVAAGPAGEPLAYYDDATRMLRVLGRVLPVPPPGQTLVALLDARGEQAAAPRLVFRIVRTPTVVVQAPKPTGPTGPTWPHGAAVDSFVFISNHPDWRSALRTDPIVRTFLDSAAEQGRA